MYCRFNHKTLVYSLILAIFSLSACVSNAVVLSDLGSDEGIIVDIKDKSLKKETLPIQIIAKPIDDFNININLPANVFIPKGDNIYVILAKDNYGKIIENNQLKNRFSVGIRYPRDIKPNLARNLKVFTLSKNGWIPLESQVDTFQRIVKTNNAEQLGIYRLLAPVDLDLKDVYIYPNPVQFGTFGGVTKSLKFQNIPLGSTIEIYTISGEKIKEIKGVASSQVLWDGERDNGDLVTSGLYIYRIQTPGGEKFGKIAVIR
ncbi:MAG: T9SS type A sorting domain-containing protein [Candidatus Poribacteria bacterium]